MVEMDGKVVPIEVKSGKAYKAHKSLDNFMKISDYHIEKAYVLSVANMEQRPLVYLPIYIKASFKRTENWKVNRGSRHGRVITLGEVIKRDLSNKGVK